MAGLQKSALKEVTQETFDVHVTKKNFLPLVYSRFFTEKFTELLTWANLLGEEERPSTATVCSMDASAPLSTRQDISFQTGTIDPILSSRRMDARDIKEYNSLQKNQPNSKEVFDLVWKDTDWVIQAVKYRLEWFACQIMFHFGYSLTSATNPRGIKTQYDIDYGLAATHKRVIKSGTANRTWDNVATSQPFLDFEDIEDAAIDFDLQWCFMNKTTFRKMARSESVQKTLFPGAVNLNQTPTLSQINDYLTLQQLPNVAIIDTKVVFENAAGTRTTVDPTLDAAGSDKMITFSGTTDLGKINWTTSPEEISNLATSVVMQTKKDNILVSKWAESINPVAEMTKGEYYAGLSIPAIGGMFQLNTLDNDATGIA